MATTPPVFGQQTPTTAASEYATLQFLIRQAMLKMQTATVVKVISCSNAGGISPVGLVTVQPMVNQMTGDRVAVAHGQIFRVPYMRMQGGANAVILDPEPGDLGVCVFASRDISSVKNTKAQANPGSFRTFDWSDAIYIGGLLNGTPTQYVAFASAGITVVSPTKIKLQAPTIEIDATTELLVTSPDVDIAASTEFDVTSPASTLTGPVHVTGTSALDGVVTAGAAVNATGDVTGEGTSLHTHVHSGVTTGSGDSGPPV